MMTTDPHLCPDVRTVRRISFNEAAELAYFGAKVCIQPPCYPLLRKTFPYTFSIPATEE